ncbi:Pilus assembly protein (plasmid) [Rhodovastum atsumiense]|uniref:Pilus assembly protein n=1 Tax=Rhodovastum atsumiense TaxID=504468 RepID=A0A5M6IJS8_9PROT|nr:TraE/TraK family type IV conjugative transfer system protein [Rhodovastum atsumiense]KAA5608523.1 pilus assembly protein [Rhodovastum atsumiense]CAH2605801.1 Pilus assembly protein [Rhodovastum atsumiense]
MRFTSAMANWAAAQTAAKILMAALIGESVAVVALSYALIRVDRTVVMMSPDGGREDTVSQSAANRPYLEAWAFHLSTTFGNVTPDTVTFIKDRIGPILCPAIYTDAMLALSEQAATITRERVAISFEPRSVLFEDATGKVFVNGQAVNRAVMGTENRYQRTFEFVIRVSNYRVEVCGLRSYEGGPRTEQVLEQMKQREKSASPVKG